MTPEDQKARVSVIENLELAIIYFQNKHIMSSVLKKFGEVWTKVFFNKFLKSESLFSFDPVYLPLSYEAGVMGQQLL